MNTSGFLKFLAATIAVVPAVFAPAADAASNAAKKIYANYSAPEDGTSVTTIVCGTLPDGDSGCFAYEVLSPFEHACAVLESKPETKAGVTTREIYVLDKRASKSSSVMLNIFTRTDTITETMDQVQIALSQQIPLGIKGGPKAHCAMAGNDRFLYAGTDKSASGIILNKSTLAVQPIGNTAVASIIADDDGFVSMNFAASGGHIVFAPTGLKMEGGGGSSALIGAHNSWLPN